MPGAELVDGHMVFILVWLKDDLIHASKVRREVVQDWLSTNPTGNVKVCGLNKKIRTSNIKKTIANFASINHTPILGHATFVWQNSLQQD